MKFTIVFQDDAGNPVSRAQVECDNSTASFAAACISVKERHDQEMMDHNSPHGSLHDFITRLRSLTRS